MMINIDGVVIRRNERTSEENGAGQGGEDRV